MAEGSIAAQAPLLRGRVSEEEWQARVELAALYRLVALHGWDDMIFTHISARVPGPEHHFLINPYGLFFEEITASSLVKVDLDGNVVAGHALLRSIRRASPSTRRSTPRARTRSSSCTCTPTQGVAVAAQTEGLLPLTQHALAVLPQPRLPRLRGHRARPRRAARLVADLGDKTLMLLRNHGTLAVGATAAEAGSASSSWSGPASEQVMALTAGATGRPARARAGAGGGARAGFGRVLAKLALLAWPGLLRKLDRHLPGYDV